ncbi:hybrid sensor histidine kinase/response regulator [Hydrogenophaga intermedia]|uniref:histidine kinase n=2 Tax=Comamonadaceae TaxID=80864 RepID=A0A1L1PI90_HYDIT|nr:hybrid sensor histidine kinase/response regulator [Hydrogenophaga intermedia]CDN89130.1 Sensory box histidine kinase/response regulator [Hydrogenophaga intermedia]
MLVRMEHSLAPAERLRGEQVRLLANNVPALIVGTLILATGTGALLWAHGQAPWPVAGWLVAMVLLCAARLGLLRRFRRAASKTPERWAPAFVLASAVAGLCWGALAWLFFTPDAPLMLAIVAIVLMSILSSATQSLGPFFPAHLAFALPCVLPFAARCLWSGQGSLITLGALTLVYLLMTELFALRIARAIEDALRLRFENESLVARLTMENERAATASLAKTRFLATASHDLRQPIHAMSLFVPALKALATQATMNPRVVGNIAERLQAALDTMAQLLNRLLDISRLDAGALQPSPQPVSLHALLHKVSDEVAQQALAKGLKLRVRDHAALMVQTDPAILHTILSNLASNAVRYTERGGVLLAARRRGDRVRLEVWDSGIGISAEDLPRITDEFFQAEGGQRDASQSRGFGLGLAIVKRSADLLGSPLRVRSRPGRGSVFAIELPLAHPGASQDACGPAGTARHRPGRRVLVVDNDEQILAAMSYLLRGWGHEPLLAGTLDEVLTHLDAGAVPELALIDLHLASNEHGLQVAECLRERLGPRIRLAVVTGDTGPEALASICAAGVTGLHKPVDPERLLRFIDGSPTPTGPGPA